MKYLPLLILISLMNFWVTGNAQESVFYTNQGKSDRWILYQNNDQALYKIITNQAFLQLNKRKEQVAKLSSQQDWIDYQKNLKAKVFQSLDRFEKTPLNAKVTGKLERGNFTAQKILFESHPGFFVTATLFIPKKIQKPAPTVIYCSGHTELGFRSEVYQRVIINLVEKGFVVFAFDPIGQGERLQYLDPETGKSKVGGPTTEHSYAGAQTLLTGISLTDYFIWDGVRAIDYLETRPEVDMQRIGITGRSGGGTQSALIAAYDHRIYAAAPECYITSFERLLQSIGPQDAEQNPYNAIKLGFDHPDFMHLRAPKPTLIVTTTHDFFSQQGARESFAEAKKSYAAFGFPDNLKMVEDFGVHESTKNNRESVYAFFQKSLNLPGNSEDHEIVPFTYDELLVTSTGQVATSVKSKTVFELNRDYFVKKEVENTNLTEKIKSISGIDFNRKLERAVYTGKITDNNIEVEKYFLENNQKDYALPVYVAKSVRTTSKKWLVYLSSGGKAEIADTPMCEFLMNVGYTIVSADLPGIGELKDSGFKGDGFVNQIPFNYTFGANLAGKSIPGIQAEAIDLLMQFIAEINPGKKEIDAVIQEETNSPFLHFAILKNPFAKIVLLNPLESNNQLITTEFFDAKLAYSVVPGSLPYYDFRDLVSLIPEKSVKIIQSQSFTKPENKGKWDSELLDFLMK